MNNEEFVSPERASQLLKVTVRTLQNWSIKGTLKTFRTNGGHRRFLLSDIKQLMSTSEVYQEKPKQDICYCRVSTVSQKEDLERQVSFFGMQYPNHLIIKDIGSGLNFKRKGLQTILDIAIKGNLGEVVVTHKDRLCRFGFELILSIIQKCSNGKIVVLNNEQTSPEKELVDDLLSIITVFSSRLYGLRSHSIRKKIKQATQDQENRELQNPQNTPISN